MTDPYHVIEDLCATLENVRHLVNGKEQQEIDGQISMAAHVLEDKDFESSYIIVPAPANMECIGPFETMKEAARYADHFYAGQVNCIIKTLNRPEE